ncbi:hypothetical protein FHX41_5277 [Actinomadura hallensis]|uniref:DUF5753 domain-containing protein n=1 Tax=Actinomadura hallensis TaxID=337895 RepID=A0A543ILU2_9ACTN|nr:DUF5753 domain-containing protein [Actinomadura hallensis]TQM71508.1 hypothetical protein FHX41_5277 [Actinomadura hallensis]
MRARKNGRLGEWVASLHDPKAGVEPTRFPIAPQDGAEGPDEGVSRGDARLSGHWGFSARQTILRKSRPPRMWFVIDESALRRPAGGREAFRNQLNHLAQVMRDHPNVQVRVLPFESITWAGLDGSFEILQLPGEEKAAYLEFPGLGQLIHDPSKVEATSVRFHLVMGEALPAGASLKMILEKAEEYR